MTPPIFPSPPTDNLYKFIAVTGLILLFGAPVYWSSYTNAAHGQQAETWRTLFQKAATPYEYYVPPQPPADPEAARAQERRLAELRKEVERHEKEYQLANAALSKYERFAAAVNVVSLLATVAGVVLAAVGFRLWYVRVQRPQDRLLEKQLEQAKSTSA